MSKTGSHKIKTNEFVRPAFESYAQAGFFLLLVLVALILPALFDRRSAGLEKAAYEMVPEDLGAFSFVKNEVFEKDEELDILFLGSSVMFAGIDATAVRDSLSRELGRPANVAVFGHYFNSIDVSYVQLRDLLERRRVKMIVYSVPRGEFPEGPSPSGVRFIRYGDVPELTAELPLNGKLSLYASSVLNLPKDLLAITRDNLEPPSPFEKDLGADVQKMAMGRDVGKFVEIDPPAPDFKARELIFPTEESSHFDLSDKTVSDYQKVFLKRLFNLARDERIPLIMLNIPQLPEKHSPKIVVLDDWARNYGLRTKIVGVAPAELFAGLSESEIEKMYFDERHFNANGNEFFTQSVMPGILEVFRENEK